MKKTTRKKNAAAVNPACGTVMNKKEKEELLRICSSLEHTMPIILGYFNYFLESAGVPKQSDLVLTLERLCDREFDKFSDRFCKRLRLVALAFGDLIPEKVNINLQPWEIMSILHALEIIKEECEQSELMAEINKAPDPELAFLSYLFEAYLSYIFSRKEGEYKEDKEHIFRTYLLCVGIYVYLKREYWIRMHRGNNIDPNDSDTFFESPVAYQAFYELSKNPLKNEKSQLVLEQLQEQAENKTKGYYHPEDDPERTLYKKFYPEDKTEAERLYNLELTKILNEKFSELTTLESIEKLFAGDGDLAKFPSSFKKDLINDMESREAKKRGITIKEWRKLEKEIDEEEKRVQRNEVPPDRLEQLHRLRKDLIKKESRAVLTDTEDFEDKPVEMQLSGDSTEYVIAGPEATSESVEEKDTANKEIRTLIREYIDSLAPQAKGEKGVGNFLLRNIIAKYINKRGHFNITKIQKDSGIPLSTVKRFCKGFFNKSKSNKKR